jgi:hypothetical protein
LDGHVICWWKPAPDALGALMSVRDPGSSQPARRVLDDGSEEPVAGAPNGLVLYGRTRVDRPSFAVAAQRTPEYAYLLQGTAEGRGVTTGR